MIKNIYQINWKLLIKIIHLALKISIKTLLPKQKEIIVKKVLMNNLKIKFQDIESINQYLL